MSENSKIEWTTHTFNPWIGCTKVSPGCKHCYAETLMDHRYKKVEWGPNGTRVRTSASNWSKPFQWDKKAKAAGERHRVFCASLADVFEDRDEMIPWRRELFDLIDSTHHLDWLLLTKRPENVMRLIPKTWPFNHEKAGDKGICRNCKRWEHEGHCDWCSENGPYNYFAGNIWLGTSVENQEAADERIPHLLKVPAAVRFLSIEPLLGPVELPLRTGEVIYDSGGNANDQDPPSLDGINWVIVGGESGPNARPMHPSWVRSIRDQCVAVGVPFFFKQWGEWKPFESGDQMLQSVPYSERFGSFDGNRFEIGCAKHSQALSRVGKKAAGRILDGREWSEFPTSARGDER